MTVRLISSQVGASGIKSLAEAAFVSSSSVVAMATAPEPVATATMSPKASSPSTSEPSATVTTAEASVTTVSELLLLQLWELCGYSQLPTATVLPIVLNLLDFISRDVKTNSCFAFEEGHSVNVVLNLIS